MVVVVDGGAARPAAGVGRQRLALHGRSGDGGEGAVGGRRGDRRGLSGGGDAGAGAVRAGDGHADRGAGVGGDQRVGLSGRRGYVRACRPAAVAAAPLVAVRDRGTAVPGAGVCAQCLPLDGAARDARRRAVGGAKVVRIGTDGRRRRGSSCRRAGGIGRGHADANRRSQIRGRERVLVDRRAGDVRARAARRGLVVLADLGGAEGSGVERGLVDVGVEGHAAAEGVVADGELRRAIRQRLVGDRAGHVDAVQVEPDVCPVLRGDDVVVAPVGAQRGGRHGDVAATRLAQREGARGQDAEGGRAGALAHQVADRSGGGQADDAHPQLVGETVAVVERGAVWYDDVALAAGGEAHGRVGLAGQRADLVEREGATVGAVVVARGLVGGRRAGRLAEAPVGARRVGQNEVCVAAARTAAPLVCVVDRRAARPGARVRRQRLAYCGGAGDARQGAVGGRCGDRRRRGRSLSARPDGVGGGDSNEDGRVGVGRGHGVRLGGGTCDVGTAAPGAVAAAPAVRVTDRLAAHPAARSGAQRLARDRAAGDGGRRRVGRRRGHG